MSIIYFNLVHAYTNIDILNNETIHFFILYIRSILYYYCESK